MNIIFFIFYLTNTLTKVAQPTGDELQGLPWHVQQMQTETSPIYNV